MTRSTRLRVVLLVAAVFEAGAIPAIAQFRGGTGLFGGGRAAEGQSASISLLLGGTFEPDRIVPGDIDLNTLRTSDYGTSLSAGGRYSMQTRRIQLHTDANSDFRYFPDLEQTRSTGNRISAGFATALPGRSSLSLTQTASYAPSFFYGEYIPSSVVIPDEGTPAPPQYVTVDRLDSHYSYGTNLTVARPLTRRTSFSVDGDLQFINFVHDSEIRHDTRSYGLGASYRWRTARETSVNVEYRYRESEVLDSFDPSPSIEHSVNFGFNQQRRISATRTVRLTGRIGASTGEIPVAFGGPEGQLLRERRYWANVDFNVNYPLSRDWQLLGNYGRHMTYMGLVTPVFNDNAGAGISGMLTRRLQLLAAADYASGESFRGADYVTYSASVRTTYAMTQSLAVFGEYVHRFYRFGPDSVDGTRPPGLTGRSLRAGLSLWVPLL